jgi:hypothetical protein
VVTPATTSLNHFGDDDDGDLEDCDQLTRQHRRQLSRSWTPARITGEDIRQAVFRRWNCVFDIDLVERNGCMNLALHMCSPQPDDTAAFMRKLDDLADRLTAWSCGEVALHRIRGSLLEIESVCEDDDAPATIHLGINMSRIAEFEGVKKRN